MIIIIFVLFSHYTCDFKSLLKLWYFYELYIFPRYFDLYIKAFINVLRIIVAELGDYQVDELEPNYLSGMTLVPGQTEEMERKICELHKLHK